MAAQHLSALVIHSYTMVKNHFQGQRRDKEGGDLGLHRVLD